MDIVGVMVSNFSSNVDGVKKQKYFTHDMLIFELPKLTRTNVGRSRFYFTPEGKKYPSITTIISWENREGILAWKKREGEEKANKISRETSNRGTKIHSICESYLKNKADYVEGHEQEHISMFKQFQSSVDRINNIKCQETRLYSDELCVAGTVDCIAEFEGKLSVIDFKTKRKQIRKEWTESYFKQCAGYAKMWEERTKIPIEQLVVLVTAATGENKSQVFVENRDMYNDLRIPQLKELIKRFNGAQN